MEFDYNKKVKQIQQKFNIHRHIFEDYYLLYE